MEFGPVSPQNGIGAIVVHSLRYDGIALKKGAVLSAKDAEALERAGIASIVVARLSDNDVSEDTAAAAVAAAVAGAGVRVEPAATGRANLFATVAGVLVMDADAVTTLNSVDEAITLATLTAYKPVVAGEMIATVKIIPFAVPRPVHQRALAVASRAVISVQRYCRKRAGLVVSVAPGMSSKIADKTQAVTRQRLAAAGADLVMEMRIGHDVSSIAAAIAETLKAGADIVIVFGASAIADRRDVIPLAVEAMGGRVECFGMPVDPGNLLLIGNVDGIPVLGAPGCARSPKENGFDWVLNRLLAGIPVHRTDIARMGVGGLLMEIATRPQPRSPETAKPNRQVAAVVLAAGQSSRMAGANKLVSEIDGVALIRRVVDHVLASQAWPVVVVTGHDRERVERALAGCPVKFAHNEAAAEGIGSSIRAGIAALPADVEGAMICLGDMPLVDGKLLDALIDRFAPDHGAPIVVPTCEGRRGNPVVWSRQFFPELSELTGDSGARHLIVRHRQAVAEVSVDRESAFLDLDTPESWSAFGGGRSSIR